MCSQSIKYFSYSTEKSDLAKLYKLITNWAIKNNIDYIWAIHSSQSLKNIFPVAAPVRMVIPLLPLVEPTTKLSAAT